jgi:hypothetical protein
MKVINDDGVAMWMPVAQMRVIGWQVCMCMFKFGFTATGPKNNTAEHANRSNDSQNPERGCRPREGHEPAC